MVMLWCCAPGEKFVGLNLASKGLTCTCEDCDLWGGGGGALNWLEAKMGKFLVLLTSWRHTFFATCVCVWFWWWHRGKFIFSLLSPLLVLFIAISKSEIEPLSFVAFCGFSRKSPHCFQYLTMRITPRENINHKHKRRHPAHTSSAAFTGQSDEGWKFSSHLVAICYRTHVKGFFRALKTQFIKSFCWIMLVVAIFILTLLSATCPVALKISAPQILNFPKIHLIFFKIQTKTSFFNFLNYVEITIWTIWKPLIQKCAVKKFDWHKDPQQTSPKAQKCPHQPTG